jgi:hypothetical protein
VVVEDDKQDEVVPNGYSPEHGQRRCGGVMTVNSGGGASLVREWRRVRESSGARVVWGALGCCSPFIGARGAF